MLLCGSAVPASGSYQNHWITCFVPFGVWNACLYAVLEMNLSWAHRFVRSVFIPVVFSISFTNTLVGPVIRSHVSRAQCHSACPYSTVRFILVQFDVIRHYLYDLESWTVIGKISAPGAGAMHAGSIICPAVCQENLLLSGGNAAYVWLLFWWYPFDRSGHFWVERQIANEVRPVSGELSPGKK